MALSTGLFGPRTLCDGGTYIMLDYTRVQISYILFVVVVVGGGGCCCSHCVCCCCCCCVLFLLLLLLWLLNNKTYQFSIIIFINIDYCLLSVIMYDVSCFASICIEIHMYIYTYMFTLIYIHIHK